MVSDLDNTNTFAVDNAEQETEVKTIVNYYDLHYGRRVKRQQRSSPDKKGTLTKSMVNLHALAIKKLFQLFAPSIHPPMGLASRHDDVMLIPWNQHLLLFVFCNP